jgi:hypothetical protein
VRGGRELKVTSLRKPLAAAHRRAGWMVFSGKKLQSPAGTYYS